MEPIIFIDNQPERGAYQRFQKAVKMLNLMKQAGMILTEDYFNSEVEIRNNLSRYDFPTLQMSMDTAAWPLSKGVEENDLFIGTSGCIYIDHRVSTQTDVIPLRYPNPQQFTNAVNTGSTKDLYSLYNGRWSYQVGPTVFIPGQSTRLFLQIPMAQQSLAGITNATEIHGNQLISMVPNVVISGKGTNKLVLDFQTFAGWAGASLINGEQNVISFFFRGFTIQNGAGMADYFTGARNLEKEFSEWFAKNKTNLEAVNFLQQPGA